MSKKEKELSTVLKTINLDKPSIHFTENILDLIAHDVLVNNEEESTLKPYLDERVLPTVSDTFTITIMTSIANESKEDCLPLLSVKTKIVSFIIFILVCLIATFSRKATTGGFNEHTWLQLQDVLLQFQWDYLLILYCYCSTHLLRKER